MGKNLIISPTGLNTYAYDWIKEFPEFDITLLCHVEDDEYCNKLSQTFDVVRINYDKWKKIKTYLKENPRIIEQYENFWFPDDDIKIDTKSINELFDIHSKNNLSLSQPAIIGYISHNIVKPQPNLLRYVSFVEIMCPMMSRDCLKLLIETFDLSESGWGLDILWGKLLEYKNMAIIDKIIAEHTRPIGINYEGRFSKHPMQELNELIQIHSLNIIMQEYGTKKIT